MKDGELNVDSIKSIISMMGEDGNYVHIGLVKGIFTNEDKIESQLKAKGVGEAFDDIIADMKGSYE